MTSVNALYRHTFPSFKQMCRERDREQARIDAAACDCWKQAGPICAACQATAAERAYREWVEDGGLSLL